MGRKLIYQDDAIDAIVGLVSSMSVCISIDECHGMKRMQGMVVRALDELPSAQPERKKGEWIFKDHLWECNQCGCRCNRANPLSGNIWNYYYCPNCGADMRGEEDDE